MIEERVTTLHVYYHFAGLVYFRDKGYEDVARVLADALKNELR